MALMWLDLLATVLLVPAHMANSTRARQSNRYEVLVGRSLAACVHPFAAWRSPARSFRVLAIAGYFAAGYLAVLITMAFVR